MVSSFCFDIVIANQITAVAKHHRGDLTWTPSTKAKKMARKKSNDDGNSRIHDIRRFSRFYLKAVAMTYTTIVRYWKDSNETPTQTPQNN